MSAIVVHLKTVPPFQASPLPTIINNKFKDTICSILVLVKTVLINRYFNKTQQKYCQKGLAYLTCTSIFCAFLLKCFNNKPKLKTKCYIVLQKQNNQIRLKFSLFYRNGIKTMKRFFTFQFQILI